MSNQDIKLKYTVLQPQLRTDVGIMPIGDMWYNPQFVYQNNYYLY